MRLGPRCAAAILELLRSFESLHRRRERRCGIRSHYWWNGLFSTGIAWWSDQAFTPQCPGDVSLVNNPIRLIETPLSNKPVHTPEPTLFHYEPSEASWNIRRRVARRSARRTLR